MRSESEGADVAVIEGAEAAASVLDGTRRELLLLLREPRSAAGLARLLGQPRQRVNYHVRALEQAGLVEEVERRQRRGVEERVMRAKARRYVISPVALGELGADPREVRDRFSVAYQLAMAARTIAEVSALSNAAVAAGKVLPTLAVDTEVEFATQSDRDAFAAELVETIGRLVTKYHSGSERTGRRYRVYVGSHPSGRPERGEGR